MSKLWKRIAGLFGNRSMAGVDKSGNRYFARTEPMDGVMKEKRWVVFKGEEDPTSIPVEWICWLNGQRKKAPTLEEMMELEAKRERVRLNVALQKSFLRQVQFWVNDFGKYQSELDLLRKGTILKKEEEEKRGIRPKAASTGKVGGPDLRSFIQQFPANSKGGTVAETSGATDGMRNSEESETDKEVPSEHKQQPESSEPMGSGASFRPGTWQPPT